eukprot:gene17142-23605_t
MSKRQDRLFEGASFTVQEQLRSDHVKTLALLQKALDENEKLKKEKKSTKSNALNSLESELRLEPADSREHSRVVFDLTRKVNQQSEEIKNLKIKLSKTELDLQKLQLSQQTTLLQSQRKERSSEITLSTETPIVPSTPVTYEAEYQDLQLQIVKIENAKEELQLQKQKMECELRQLRLLCEKQVENLKQYENKINELGLKRFEVELELKKDLEEVRSQLLSERNETILAKNECKEFLKQISIMKNLVQSHESEMDILRSQFIQQNQQLKLANKVSERRSNESLTLQIIKEILPSEPKTENEEIICLKKEIVQLKLMLSEKNQSSGNSSANKLVPILPKNMSRKSSLK